MTNNSNLIPFDSLSEERHKELSRLGGIASGVARRKKAELKQQIIDEGRIQNELARSAFSTLHEASSILLEASLCYGTRWALEYSPKRHSYRILKTEVAAARNLKGISEGASPDYILLAVASTKESLQKLISRE